MWQRAWWWAGALLCGALFLCAASLQAQPLLDAQRAQVLALGPWPPPWRPDTGNRVSGKPPAIELGRLLFRDARMSPVGYIACVTCHMPDRAFTDGKARAHGLADLPRNTPTLANLRLQTWYGWGGVADSLWLASILPILDAREFDGNAASVARLFVRDTEMAACYRAVFSVSALSRPERTLVNVGKAIAAYVETLVTGRTPFDEFRDALAQRDQARADAYPAAARRGLLAFVGEAGCVVCHAGPNFSDGRFHRSAAAPPDTATRGAGAPRDAGRLDDVRRLVAHPLNQTSAANDDTSRRNAAATRALEVHTGLDGLYRTPSLRNVAVTAPYLHDGRADTLHQAVQHAAQVRPLATQRVEDLVAFLLTLTDEYGERRPWQPSEIPIRCR